MNNQMLNNQLQPKVSVVLPIYNVEKYLNRCIESVINQTYVNLEIILIDDGSPDNCPTMCDEWAEKDGRIKVVHKKNAGLGMARNTGIKNATGKFIFFVDSDDYIELNAIEKCVNAALNNNAENVIYGFNKINKYGKIIDSVIPNPGKFIYSGHEVINNFLPDLIAKNPLKRDSPNLLISAWACMYSLDVIKKSDWCFVSEREIIAEDVYSNLDLYKNINCVVILKDALYNYCFNEVSLTHTYRKDRFEKIKYFYEQSIKKAAELGYPNEIHERLKYPLLSFTIGALKMIVHARCSKKEKKDNFKKVISDELLLSIVRSIPLKYEPLPRKIFYWALRHRLVSISYILSSLRN